MKDANTTTMYFIISSLKKKVILFTLVYFYLHPSGIAQKNHIINNGILQQASDNIEKFRKGDFTLLVTDFNGNLLKNVALDINQTTHEFHFGAIIFELVRKGRIRQEQQELFKKRFSHLFNYAVFPFYWAAYEKKPGHPAWYRMEEIIGWCQENGITCKGHPLAWTHTAGTPYWIYNLPEQEATEMLKSRIIENTMGFKDKIDIWDVVNEPVNTVDWKTALNDTSMMNDHRYGMNQDIKQLANWIDLCYRWAHQGNPEADLILNEFGQIADEETRQRFYNLLKELQKRQTPVTGIGIQAHEPRQDWYDPAEVWETLELYSEFNIPLHITEFIPQSSGKPIEGGYISGTWSHKKQAEYARIMYTLAFGHPSVVSVNWWGVSENDIWLEGGGLLEKDLSPKPVYHALDRLINKEWKTHFRAKTDQKGEFTARGFFGDYRVTVTDALGKKHSFTFSHERDQESNWKIKID